MSEGRRIADLPGRAPVDSGRPFPAAYDGRLWRDVVRRRVATVGPVTTPVAS